MKIAIVHDYLISYGGAERVLEALHEIWPEAPVYTAWVDWPWLKKNKPEWQEWDIRPTWFDKLPLKKQLCSPLRFLTPWIWKSLDLNSFDVVISSSAWYMPKAVSLYNSKPKHICYCHTPPRYLYGYGTARNTKHPLIKLYAYIVNPFMRYYDYRSSEKVDLFIANSLEVKKRIWKFYRKEAKVVYPPIKIRTENIEFRTQGKKKGYFLAVNRLVGSKHTDIAIKACLKLGKKLKIVGEGPQESYLKDLSGDSELIEFLGYVDEKELSKLYQNCQAVLYLPTDEDFGIVPVEAASFGKLVIGVDGGGVKETVVNGKTGILLKKLNTRLLVEAINKLEKINISPEDCFKQAQKFNKERFVREIKKLVLEI